MQGFCDRTIGEWQDVEKHLLDMSYIQKYNEYIAFLRENRKDLLENDNWDSLFNVLPLLKLSDEYTLDDYRSKKTQTTDCACMHAK